MSLLPASHTWASHLRPALVWSALLTAGALPAAETPAQPIEQFLNRYCLECHDAKVHKGDRSFERFKLPLGNLPAVIEARDIIDQLTLREMPPKKADQPSDEERLAAIRPARRHRGRRGFAAEHGLADRPPAVVQPRV